MVEAAGRDALFGDSVYDVAESFFQSAAVCVGGGFVCFFEKFFCHRGEFSPVGFCEVDV